MTLKSEFPNHALFIGHQCLDLALLGSAADSSGCSPSGVSQDVEGLELGVELG